ncbi:MAG: hypothetical protein N2491_01865 [Negativicutes bacterium]|nr:hypothetical protein [Negativicutes bacterium]
MEQILKEILSAVKSLDNKVSDIDKRLNNLETDVTEIKTDIAGMKTDIANLEGQMIETNQIVKALLHRSEETDAKLESLAVNTASRYSVERLEKAIDRVATDMNYLVRKSVEHDDDIRELRRAK